MPHIASYMRGAHELIWVPSDPEAEWLNVWIETDPPELLTGSWEAVRDERVDLRLYRPGNPVRSARYGVFHSVDFDYEPKPGGNWYQPTPQFIANLPRDPSALSQAVSHEQTWSGPVTVPWLIRHLLRTGRVPSDLSESLYLLLANDLETVYIEDVTNLDGEAGDAFVTTTASSKLEIIISKDGRRYIGSRHTALNDRDERSYISDGTVIEEEALHYAVVTAIAENAES